MRQRYPTPPASNRSARSAGQLAWQEDPRFDIDHHVRHSALIRPGRYRELFDLCGRLHSTPLPRDRPLWEAHVIEGLAGNKFAVYVKMHHSLIDGVGAMKLTMAFLDTTREGKDRGPMPEAGIIPACPEAAIRVI